VNSFGLQIVHKNSYDSKCAYLEFPRTIYLLKFENFRIKESWGKVTEKAGQLAGKPSCQKS